MAMTNLECCVTINLVKVKFHHYTMKLNKYIFEFLRQFASGFLFNLSKKLLLILLNMLNFGSEMPTSLRHFVISI